MDERDSSLTEYDSDDFDPANDPLFGLDAVGDESSRSSIFAQRNLLKIGTVPERDRIVGRDSEIQHIAQELKPLIHGEQPNHVEIYGKTGTGKSLVAQHVSQRAAESATAHDVKTEQIYYKCKAKSTEARTIYSIATELNDRVDIDTGINVPRKGIGTEDYYDLLWNILDGYFDGLIVILDEIDKHTEINDILYDFSRVGEYDDTDTHIALVGISNKMKFRGKLDERVVSSMRAEEYIFPPYDKCQLEAILENRHDAFYENVLDEGVIQKAAADAAREHGDARKAIELLRYAGEIAERSGSTTVVEDHIDQAQPRAETERFRELIESLPPDVKLILYAIAKLEVNYEQSAFTTSQIYQRYEHLARDIREDPLGTSRVFKLLKEQVFLDILGSTTVSEGRYGYKAKHQLLHDPQVVMNAILIEDERLQELENSGITPSEPGT